MIPLLLSIALSWAHSGDESHHHHDDAEHDHAEAQEQIGPCVQFVAEHCLSNNLYRQGNDFHDVPLEEIYERYPSLAAAIKDIDDAF